MEKKEQNKKGIIRMYLISLMLGLLALGIILFFIFQEYFTDEEISWEVCKDSFILRSAAPTANIGPTAAVSFKDDFPLKCKAQVIEIERKMLEKEKGMEETEKLIAETIASCWSVFSKGDGNAFPAKFYGLKSVCVPCARIHLTPGANDYLKETNQRINIERGLVEGLEDSYYHYLQNSGDKFPALSIGGARDFYLNGEIFAVYPSDNQVGTLYNRLNKQSEGGAGYSKITLPRHIDPDEGSLIIGYGAMISSDNSKVGEYIPYLFYFQTEQKKDNGESVDPFKEITDYEIIDPGQGDLIDLNWHYANMCEEWEGIPA